MDEKTGRALQDRISRLEARIAELERRLDVFTAPPSVPEQKPESAVEIEPPPLPLAAAVEVPVAQWVFEEPRTVPPSLPRDPGEKSWEQVLGQNVALWIGAGVLLLGVLFFLQYAWNEGWINPSPAQRYWLAMGLGGVLLLLSEWQARRGLKPFAAVVGGLGVAVMMAACYAVVSEWGGRVLTPAQSIAGVAAAGAIAVVQSLRHRAMTPLVTAQVGALAAPLVLGPVFFVPPVLAGLVLVVAIVAALLVALRERSWVATLYVASIGGGLHLLQMAAFSSSAMLAYGSALAMAGVVVGALLWIESQDPDEHDRAEPWPRPERLILGVLCVAVAGSTVWLANLREVDGITMASLAPIACGALMLLRPRWCALFAVAVASTWLFAWLRLPADHWAFAPAICGWFVGFAALTTALTRDRWSHAAELMVAPALLCLAVAPGWARLAAGSYDPRVGFGANDTTLAALTAGFVIVLCVCGMIGWKREAFRITAYALAGVLATLVPVLLLDRFALSLAWLAMATMAGVTCLITRRVSFFVAGVVLWLLCIMRLASIDWGDRVLASPLAQWGGATLTGWTAYGVVLGVAGWALAWLRATWPGREQSDIGIAQVESMLSYYTPARRVERNASDGVSVMLSLMGTVVAVLSLTVGLRVLGAEWTIAVCMWTLVLLTGTLLERRAGWWGLAVVALVLAIVKWMLVDALGPAAMQFSARGVRDVVTPLANAPALAGLFALVLLYFAYRLDGARRIRAIDWGAGMLIVGMAWLSVEALRGVDLASTLTTIDKPAIVKHATLSVLWATAGLVGVLAGFAFKHAGLRYAALAVLAGTLLKIVAVDMAEVQAVWRVLTFMCVGALLIGVSFLYQLQAKRERTAQAKV
jgi:uncharacterized membrane protein